MHARSIRSSGNTAISTLDPDDVKQCIGTVNRNTGITQACEDEVRSIAKKTKSVDEISLLKFVCLFTQLKGPLRPKPKNV